MGVGVGEDDGDGVDVGDVLADAVRDHVDVAEIVRDKLIVNVGVFDMDREMLKVNVSDAEAVVDDVTLGVLELVSVSVAEGEMDAVIVTDMLAVNEYVCESLREGVTALEKDNDVVALTVLVTE